MSNAINKTIEETHNVSSKKNWYRPKEAMTYLGVGLSTIYLYQKQGKLVGKKISSRVRVYSLEELNNLFDTDEVS